MRAIMIDLETMGKRPTSAIASIGAVVFDPHSDWIGDALHVHVCLDDCQRYGLTFCASTVLWWMQADDDARDTLARGQLVGEPLHVALRKFAEFYGQQTPGGEIWCNGNSFDLPILANAFYTMCMDTPWDYFQERDLRTLKGLNKGLRIERDGTHHNALDDARHQARLVQHILQSNSDLDA